MHLKQNNAALEMKDAALKSNGISNNLKLAEAVALQKQCFWIINLCCLPDSYENLLQTNNSVSNR